MLGRTVKSGLVRGVPTALLVGVLASVCLPAGVAYSARSAPSAHTADSLKATDTAHLHYVAHGSSGSKLVEEGSATGTLPGTMRATCVLGPTLSASFVITTRYGTIVGHGTATPHGSGLYESFAGTMVATGGTGRYAHAHGQAGLYGVVNRRTLSMTVQTTGTLSF